jgi:hypothetical protein
MKKHATELRDLAKRLVKAEVEGDWSHKFVITPDGVLGLDFSEHRNEGYKLVKLPVKIQGALQSLGLLKKMKSLGLYDNNVWAVSLPNGVLDVRENDFKKLVESKLVGVRVDSDQTLIYFKG